MEIKDVLVRPIVTEKSTTGLGTENTYAFEVTVASTKTDIRRAIEAFYEVQVASVRTMVIRGKIKRFGRRVAKQSNWKKAYVTLAAGQTITIHEA